MMHAACAKHDDDACSARGMMMMHAACARHDDDACSARGMMMIRIRMYSDNMF